MLPQTNLAVTGAYYLYSYFESPVLDLSSPGARRDRGCPGVDARLARENGFALFVCQACLLTGFCPAAVPLIWIDICGRRGRGAGLCRRASLWLRWRRLCLVAGGRLGGGCCAPTLPCCRCALHVLLGARPSRSLRF